MSAEKTFRVWCVTWDDKEEYGGDVVQVDCGTPPGISRTIPFHRIEVYGRLDAERAAEEYASWAHDNRDGWECTWPLVFRVRCPDGSLVDFEVERDFDPTFSAAPVERNGVTQ